MFKFFKIGANTAKGRLTVRSTERGSGICFFGGIAKSVGCAMEAS
jgi:hypothetical protein